MLERKLVREELDTIYWPSIGKELHEYVQNRKHCYAMKPYQQKGDRVRELPPPTLPWETAATGIFEWNGIQYLVIVDAYSN